jgi:hypothetical protein
MQSVLFSISLLPQPRTKEPGGLFGYFVCMPPEWAGVCDAPAGHSSQPAMRAGTVSPVLSAGMNEKAKRKKRRRVSHDSLFYEEEGTEGLHAD